MLVALVLALRPSASGAQPAAPSPPAQEPGAAAETAAEAAVSASPEEEKAAPAAGGARAAPPSDVEVIRIRGRAVTGIDTEVPASVAQFNAADIQALGAQNVSDLAKVTPNVEIKTAGSTAPTFFIRGVGLSDFSANAAGAVAIYQDDVAVNAPAIQLGTLYDLENVEVLRGPQSVACCRNASAGAIKLYSRKPTGDLSAELRSSVGNYSLKDFEGAVSAPIVEEMLATRLAFRWTERGPIAENRCGGVNAGNTGLQGGVVDERRLPPPPPVPPPGLNTLPLNNAGPEFCTVGPPVALINPRYDPTRPYQSPNPNTRASFDADGDPRTVVTSPIPDGLAEGVNDIGNWAARGQLRFQPPATDMDWLLNLHGSHVDQLSTLGQAMGTKGGLGFKTLANYGEPDQAAEFEALRQVLGPGAAAAELAERLARRLDSDPYAGDYDRTGDTKLEAWGASLRGEWTLGPVSLTSVSGYDTYNRSRDTDQDFTPTVLFEATAEDDAWQFFQELGVHGELADFPFRWDVGGWYLREVLHSSDTQFTHINSVSRDYTQDLWSFAGYAGFAWDFLDDFTLEGGVRYNWDRKDFDFALTVVGPPTTNFETMIGQAPTGNLTLSYRFNEDVSAYWKYTRGWKPGTFNSIPQAGRQATPALPETIDAFETGLRGSYLDGRLQLGGALFYYSYKDYQVFVLDDAPLAPPTLQIINANDAEVYGAELDLQLEPLVDLVPGWLEGLVITGRFGWLETQFLDFTTEVVRRPSPGVIVTVTEDFTGNPLINSPKFKVSLAADWTFDLGRWGALIPRYDFAWSSDIFFDANEGLGSPNKFGGVFLPEYTAGQAAYGIQNARLAYRVPDGDVEVALWVRNFMDKVYKTYAFDASIFSNVVINFVGEPRTYGLDLIVRF